MKVERLSFCESPGTDIYGNASRIFYVEIFKLDGSVKHIDFKSGVTKEYVCKLLLNSKVIDEEDYFLEMV